MKRNCNLELRLVPPACVSNSISQKDKESIDEEKEHGRQQLTIFYDGKVVVSDATELQARAIIHLASREMTDNTTTTIPSPSVSEPSSPLLTCPSTKRSLQRFLQKRKSRTQAISPYHH
ncbi:hypothetical protein HAX54_017239 [Datura stramonium]|uniref:Protein TIFY n=1 Tax=Datura stramonium TaxID=4076 RepID=A0ABS8UMM2_DATST|nr:hypothetical protein [Datura stramonium]